MIQHTKTRSRGGAILAVAIFFLGGGLAYAYWTNTGSGTASGNTGTNDAISIVQTSTVADLAPGSPAQTLSGTFDNPNPGPVYVASVTAAIASVTKATDAPLGTCDSTDYTLSNAVMTVNAQVPAGDAQGTWTGAAVRFNNKATNQDACKNATLTFSYTAA